MMRKRKEKKEEKNPRRKFALIVVGFTSVEPRFVAYRCIPYSVLSRYWEFADYLIVQDTFSRICQKPVFRVQSTMDLIAG